VAAMSADELEGGAPTLRPAPSRVTLRGGVDGRFGPGRLHVLPISDGPPPYAVAYLRVSTQEQAQHGLGLATQRDAIVKWATEHGRTIIGWHRDEGRSGTLTLEQRVALVSAVDQAVLEGCELVVYRLDRLARDLIVQEECLRELSRKGGALRSCDATEDRLMVDPSQVDDADAHTRILMRQIIGAVGQWERSMTRMRLRQGRRKADQEGYYTGGYPPYGWLTPTGSNTTPRGKGSRAPKKRWLPDPGPRWAIAGWIMDCRRDGCGYRIIANELNRRGIEPPGAIVGKVTWHPSAVQSVTRGVLRMIERGYATPGWRPPGSGRAQWGHTDQGRQEQSAPISHDSSCTNGSSAESASSGTPAAL